MQAHEKQLIPETRYQTAIVGSVPKKLIPVTFNAFLGAEVASRLDKKGKGHANLVSDLNWTKSTVGRKLRGETPLTVKELLTIANYLNAPAWEIVETALADFGGIEKLLADEEMSEGKEHNVIAFPDTKTDYDIYPGKKVAHELDDEADSPDGQ